MTTKRPASTGEPLLALLDRGEASAMALVTPDDGTALTYGALAERAGTLAGRLATAGVRRGDRVAFLLPNSPDLVQVVLALAALGAAAAPLNPAYTVDELTFFLSDLTPRLLLLPPGHAAAEEAAASTGTPVVTILPAGAGPPDLILDGTGIRIEAPFEPGGAGDVTLVLHTSGTTSRPKQVPLLQANLMASSRTIAAHYRLEASDVSYCAMPLFHVHGLVASTFAALCAGGSVVMPRRFTPQRFWRQARDAGITWLSAGPTLHQMILDRQDGAAVPETLRFVRSCSSALSPTLLARAEAAYGVPMLEAYGMTEASHQMASNPLPPSARIPGSVGVATGTEIAIVDHDLRFVPEGSPGEVVISGPGLTPGYVGNEAANAEAFFGDGWFRTGDWGRLEGGYLHLEGRIKEMILRGGENISPAEIEAVLLTHPSVREAVCFGVADEKYGELPAAAVTLQGDADASSLVAHCRRHLAEFKIPVTVHVVGEIPRTPTGKVQRRRVAALFDDAVPGPAPASEPAPVPEPPR